MNGKDLRECIRSSGKGVALISSKSGIPESTIFSLYKKDSVEQHFLDKIKSAGVLLQKTTKGEHLELESALREIEYLKQTIDLLKDHNQVLQYLLTEKNKAAFDKKDEVLHATVKKKNG